MERTWPVATDRLPMFLGGIALMAIETILRVVAMSLCHESVPGHLGDNRGSGNRGTFGFPFDQGQLIDRYRDRKSSVHQDVRRRAAVVGGGAVGQGSFHRQEGCLKNIEFFNFPRSGLADADLCTIVLEDLKELITLPASQFFGIPKDLIGAILGQNDASSHHRTGKRPPASLINTGDESQSLTV